MEILLSILTFEWTMDILFGIILLILLLVGLIRGFKRSIVGLLVFITVTIVLWFTTKNLIINFVLNDFMKAIGQSFKGSFIDATGQTHEETATSILEFFQIANKYLHNPHPDDYVNGLATGIVSGIALALVALVSFFISWLVSALFYIPIKFTNKKLARATGKKYRVSWLSRLSGAAIGVGQGFAFIYIFLLGLDTTVPLFNTILSEEQTLESKGISVLGGDIIKLITALQADNTKLFNWLHEPGSSLTFTYTDEKGKTVVANVVTEASSFIDTLIKDSIENAERGLNPGGEVPPTPAIIPLTIQEIPVSKLVLPPFYSY